MAVYSGMSVYAVMRLDGSTYHMIMTTSCMTMSLRTEKNSTMMRAFSPIRLIRIPKAIQNVMIPAQENSHKFKKSILKTIDP